MMRIIITSEKIGIQQNNFQLVLHRDLKKICYLTTSTSKANIQDIITKLKILRMNIQAPVIPLKASTLVIANSSQPTVFCLLLGISATLSQKYEATCIVHTSHNSSNALVKIYVLEQPHINSHTYFKIIPKNIFFSICWKLH